MRGTMREGGGYEEGGKACESGRPYVEVGADVQSSERHVSAFSEHAIRIFLYPQPVRNEAADGSRKAGTRSCGRRYPKAFCFLFSFCTSCCRSLVICILMY